MRKKRARRWWGKDNLSKTEGIGSELAYGTAYRLQQYSRDIRTSAVFSMLTRNAPFAAEKVAEIENALARVKAANVLIVGEAGVGKMDLVMEVARRLRTGQALDAIAGKHVVVLDTTRLSRHIAKNRSWKHRSSVCSARQKPRGTQSSSSRT